MTDTVDKVITEFSTTGAAQSDAALKQHETGLDGVAKKSEQTERSTLSLENRFKALERTLGTTSGQQQKFEQAQTNINRAVAQNPALQARANEAIEAARTRYLGAAAATEELVHSNAGLSAQGQAAFHSIRSIGEQIALGIPPTQALTGQINHLIFAASGQGGLSGAFGEVTGMLGRVLTPMRLVAGGAVGLAAAAIYVGNNWQEQAGEIDRAIAGVGARTGETAQSITKFASDNASASGLSVAATRNIALEFSKTGNIAVSSLKGVGDAVHGYALLTGKDATEATKAFAEALGAGAYDTGSFIKGLETLDRSYGVLDASTKEYIRTLDLAGQRSQAIQVFIDRIEPANRKAADSVGYLAKTYETLKNAASNVFNYAGPETNSAQDTLNNAIARRDEAASNPSTIGRNSRGELQQFDSYAAKLKAFEDEVARAQAAVDGFNAQKAAAQLVELSNASDKVVKAITPQIEQVQNLERALATLQAAQARGVTVPGGDAAITSIQNQIAALKDSQAEAVRYNQRVAEISASWGDVDQSTALSLQAAQNQLPVLQAVGGAAKMSAQYAADYANYIDQGKSATAAAALAASNLAARQAQVNSSAREQLASLRDQYAIASARTVQGQIEAQSQATYNGLLRQGVDSETAFAVASQQAADAQAQVYVQMQKQVRASQDRLDLALAGDAATKAQVQSDIAYREAMEAGATAAQAAAISVNTLQAGLAQAAQSADALAEAEFQAARAAHNAQFVDGGDTPFSNFTPKHGEQFTSTSNLGMFILQSQALASSMAPTDPSLSGAINKNLSSGGLSSALNYALQQQPGAANLATTTNGGSGLVPFSAYGLQDVVLKQAQSESDIMSQVDTLYQLKNAQTGDNAVKLANLQEELAWLQSRPETMARDQQIVQLYNSIKGLTDATNANTAATLNPLYSQGHGALAIGYYKAATGLEGIVGGSGGTDSTPVHMMLTPGEHLKVTPKGQAPSNDNGGGTTVVNNNTSIVFNDTRTSNARRSLRQFGQGFGQAAAAMR